MPTRPVRGHALSSDSFSRVSLGAEFLGWRLLIAADDFGRLDGRLNVLRSLVFPAREIALEQLEAWLVELEHADGDSGPIVRYTVEGRPFIALVNWEKHRSNGRRAKESRFPEPPRIPADAREAPRGSARLTSDEGRGTRDEGREGERPAAASPPAGVAPAPRARSRARPRTEPPAALSADALAALGRWASETLRRPDLAARVPELVAACLDHHRGRGTLAADWCATARTWIRREAQWTRPSAGRSPAAPGSVAARRERAGELYRDDLLAEPSEAALAAWEAAGAPRERGWWMAPAERERLRAARAARHSPRSGGAHAAA
jgi:hypothetical protein